MFIATVADVYFDTTIFESKDFPNFESSYLRFETVEKSLFVKATVASTNLSR